MHPVEMFPHHHHHQGIDNHHGTTGSRDNPRKRVARACDRCRLKKGKCDGRDQCQKCVGADVMCIYTDRKPPQQKQISESLAQALQSENFTLKKAMIVIYKELMVLRNGQLPEIDGVDWNSEKVAKGNSGRALNYIISQEAKIDNRISNEDIMHYDVETNPHQPGSPASGDSNTSESGSPKTPMFDAVQLESPTRKRKVPKLNYSPGPPQQQHLQQQQEQPQPPQVHLRAGSSYIDPSMVHTQTVSMPGPYPPTPPTTDVWPSSEVLMAFQQQFYQPAPQQWSASQPPDFALYGGQFMGSVEGDNRSRQVFSADALMQDCFV